MENESEEVCLGRWLEGVFGLSSLCNSFSSHSPQNHLISHLHACVRAGVHAYIRASVRAGEQPSLVTLERKVATVFIGTFIIIFVITAAAIFNHNSETLKTRNCATTAGLTVMVVIFATGHISGAHINPAVTFLFVVLKHFPWKHVSIYIGVQVLASVCAAFALKGVYHPFMNGGVIVPSGIAVEGTLMLNILIARYITVYVSESDGQYQGLNEPTENTRSCHRHK
ncbi:hypothetical protein V8G54_024336 [Vigna mungo]|uniref:Uncharacterized protein n=1 Tax=Vigna mungo TaxID=3915 RepID=A0AAQ3N680_VIGMU